MITTVHGSPFIATFSVCFSSDTFSGVVRKSGKYLKYAIQIVWVYVYLTYCMLEDVCWKFVRPPIFTTSVERQCTTFGQFWSKVVHYVENKVPFGMYLHCPYPLRDPAEGIKELLGSLLWHLGDQRAQGEDHEAILSWLIHKLLQVLKRHEGEWLLNKDVLHLTF